MEALTRYHEHWLELVQPIDGLVMPAVVDAPLALPPSIKRHERLQTWLHRRSLEVGPDLLVRADDDTPYRH